MKKKDIKRGMVYHMEGTLCFVLNSNKNECDIFRLDYGFLENISKEFLIKSINNNSNMKVICEGE